jgi:putative transcriptional regulator
MIDLYIEVCYNYIIGGVNMIKSKLSILMGVEKVNIQDVHEGTGINRNTISNLYHDKLKRVDYNTLSRLCEYFNCQVADILEYSKE